MIKKIYKIADKLIEVNSLYDEVHDYCKDYIAEGVPDFSVETCEEDIEYEREKSKREAVFEGRKVYEYSDGYLEEIAVYRKIAEKMPYYDTILFHGSVISVDGQGFLFTAKSGTGKSTHTRLWRKVFGDRAVMVNDDKPLMKVREDTVTVFGTPYNGKHRIGNNISVKLKGLCILERAEQNSICRVGKHDVYSMLLQQVYRPSDSESMRKTLGLVDRLAEITPLYRLGCNISEEAVEVAYNGMKGAVR